MNTELETRALDSSGIALPDDVSQKVGLAAMNASVITQAGGEVVPLEAGTTRAVRSTSLPTAAFLDELAPSVPGDPTLTEVSVVAKRCQASTYASGECLEDGPVLAKAVEDSIALALRAEMDKSFITTILNDAGVSVMQDLGWPAVAAAVGVLYRFGYSGPVSGLAVIGPPEQIDIIGNDAPLSPAWSGFRIIRCGSLDADAGCCVGDFATGILAGLRDVRLMIADNSGTSIQDYSKIVSGVARAGSQVIRPGAFVNLTLKSA